MTLAADQPCLFSGRELRADWPFGAAIEPYAFDFLMVDPPWRFELWSAAGEEKSAQAQYGVLDLEAIKALPVGDLAASHCVLWLWATFPLLPEAIEVISAWDFRYVTGGAWHKTTRHGKTAFGTGYRLRSACEPFLIGVRGDPATKRDVRNLVIGESREHSRKPVAAYQAAERLMPGARRIELFSRETRPGWTTWGDEASKFNAEGS